MISRTSRWSLLNWHFTPVQKRLGRRLQPEILGVPVYLILVTTVQVGVILLLILTHCLVSWITFQRHCSKLLLQVSDIVTPGSISCQVRILVHSCCFEAIVFRSTGFQFWALSMVPGEFFPRRFLRKRQVGFKPGQHYSNPQPNECSWPQGISAYLTRIRTMSGIPW